MYLTVWGDNKNFMNNSVSEHLANSAANRNLHSYNAAMEDEAGELQAYVIMRSVKKMLKLQQ